MSEPWHVTRRAAHSRVWESVYLVPDKLAGKTREERHSYVELATGMHYDSNGQWAESEEKFEITSRGHAIAVKGQHKLMLAANLNSGGPVDLLTPDGQRFISNPMSLIYFDSATGTSVLIGEVKDCMGEQVAPNVILYRDAFSHINGAIRYTYTKAGFSQDIVLYQNPDSPAAWGLDPATSMLVMYTEFHDPPARPNTAGGITAGLNDEPIAFGLMQIAQGVAYYQQEQFSSTRVYAQWLRSEGRDFLVEAVPFRSVQPMLEKLPRTTRKENQSERAQQVFATRRKLLAKLDSRRGKQTALASIKPGRPSTEAAFILDYMTLNTSQTNYVFLGDTTYFISGTVNLNGPNNVLEGGCVLKFENSASARITVSGQLQCKTGRYRPAVFTSKDDNSVGEVILGTSGTPSMGYYGLVLNSSDHTLINLRFSYAASAVALGFSPGQINLTNVQFVNCQAAIDSSLQDQNTIIVDNALFNSVTYGIKGGRDLIVRGQHLTVNRCGQFARSQTGGDGDAYLTNCLFVAVTNLGSDFTFITNSTSYYSADPGGVFQTVGGGAHYLTDEYRIAGTTNINPALAVELKSRTTYPPALLSSLTTNTTLTQKAPRDTTTFWRGYHYAPLDYLASGVTVASNITISVTNGVAVGIDYSASLWGFILTNAQFICTGDALNLNYVVRAHTAQEFSTGNPGTRACFYDVNSSSGSRDCEIRMRLTEFDQLANDGYLLYTGVKFGALEWTHSRVYNPSLVIDTSGNGTLVVGMTNTLWERGGVIIGTGSSGSGVTAHLRNNLIRGVSWHFIGGNNNWTVRDNLFDHPSVLDNHASAVANSHNGYDTNTAIAKSFARSVGSLGNDVIVTNFDYQAGPLGSYYYPTNGGHLSRLLDAGSRNTTNAGLYHFTTRFDQLRETNSTVDIGCHYPAFTPGTLGASTQGLVGYWALDGSAVDSSGNVHNGTLNNGPTWTSGQIGSGALSLDGVDDYMSIDDHRDLRPNNVTVAAWFNATSFSRSMTVVAKPLNGPAWFSPYLSWMIRINNSTIIETDVGNGTAYSGWATIVPTLRTGRWYHVALTYDGSTTTAYLDGNSIGTRGNVTGNLGYGSPSVLIGADYGGTSPADFFAGNIDDVRVYNRALSSTEISTFVSPTFTQLYDTDSDVIPDYLEDWNGNGVADSFETSYLAPDSDYDGISDSQEVLAGTNPVDAGSAAQTRLGYWRFNTSDWKGEQGQMPLLTNAIQNMASFDGNALQVTNAGAILKYREMEANGQANINVRSGSIRLLYKPFWSSQNSGGSGPGDWVRLVDMGMYTANASVGWFSLSIDPTGTNIMFSRQDNLGNSSTNIANVFANSYLSFNANSWTELVLTYSTNQVRLWKDTTLFMDSAVSSLPFPPANVRAQGFTIGSATNGTFLAKGLIDEFDTANYPFGRGETQFVPANVLSAAVTSTSPMIDLQWRGFGGHSYLVQRKLPAETTWINVVTNTAWHYADTNVTVAQRYEYKVSDFSFSANPVRYITSGISLSNLDNRGKIILLVDQTLANALTTELDQLKQDLVGDGWTVIRTNVARHDDNVWANNPPNIASIKTFVTNTYRADPANTKAVFIVGHVAIPYSGFLAEDGHDGTIPVGGNHYGAWGCDLYYGDVDGTWTDSLAYPPNRFPLSFPETTNSVGDGKFDQNTIPTNSARVARLELAIGRIDFARMPVFYNPPPPNPAKSEVALLKQYLSKDHRYRHKLITFPQRSIVTGLFPPPSDNANQIPYQQATRNCSAMFSFVPGSNLEGDVFADKKSCLWGIQGGDGGPSSISSGLHTSTDLTNPAKEPPVGFYLLEGSWFGDWNLNTNNFLRAVLGTANYGLASMWAHAGRWRLETLAVGDTLGDGLLRTANDTNSFPNGGGRSLAIMGDPTLRLHATAPVSNVIVVNTSPLTVAWSPSPETNVLYIVYRSINGLDGPFTRLTSTPISATSYVDAAPPSGAKTYQVRALNQVISGSGSYTNLSQGVFTTTN